MQLTKTKQIRFRRATAGCSAFVCAWLAASCTRQAPSAVPPGPDVWATVDGREIRKDEVERAYRRLEPLDQQPSEDEAVAARMRILSDMIDQNVLLEKGRALKVEVSDTEIDKAFSERKSNMPDEAFQKELAQRSLTVDDMKRDLSRELIVRKLLEREVLAKVVITDDAVREFYDQNRAKFNVAETRYRIAQIIITPVREPQTRNRLNNDATTPAEAQRKVQLLMEKIKGGADFGAIAMDYSEDAQTVGQGGDLGFIPASALNQVAPELRRAVLNAKPGEVSAVSAGGAYIIFMLVAHELAGQRDLGSPGVKETITGALRERREQLLTAAYVAAARNDVKIINYAARQLVDGGGKLPSLAPGGPK